MSDLATARALTSKYPQAWQAWLVLATAHAGLHQDQEASKAMDRARSLGFHGDAPAPGRPQVASPY